LKSWVRGRDAALDVGVTSPLQNAQVRREADHAGAALEAYKKVKMDKHFEECQQVNVEFIPLIVETLGGWDADAVSTLKRIARHMGHRSALWISTNARFDVRVVNF
jgi:hypothetical protein